MANLTQLRLAAREIFQETLSAIDAGEAVRRVVQRGEQSFRVHELEFRSPNIYSIAVGKAALAMDAAFGQILGELLTFRIVVGPHTSPGSAEQVSMTRRRWYEGGHPLPNERSLHAAQKTLEILERANSEGGLVVFLISGGGSAMMEWPINDEIKLGEVRMATKALIASGAAIGEVNAIRRAFSALKGGRLASIAPNCDQITLIVSDVPAGQEWNVSSGPTLAPPEDTPNAREVVERYGLREQLPKTIMRAIDSETSNDFAETSTKLRKHFVLCSNDDALDAAARAARKHGFAPEIDRDISDDPIESGCDKLLERLAHVDANATGDVCVISGGEFSCPVKGDGLGGRNLETALRLAIAGANMPGFVALCAGTDGIDGNSPAAGAIVDNTTVERARKIGLDPQDFLDRSDAYSFFVAIGDAITTGPTGTNVRDLRILLQSRERKQIDT